MLVSLKSSDHFLHSCCQIFVTLQQEPNEDLVFLDCSLSVAHTGCFVELFVQGEGG